MARDVREMCGAFADGDTKVEAALREVYGDDRELLEERRRAYVKLLRAFERVYGPDRSVRVFRSPARINLMGVHVDHRGGYVNYMCISREILMAAEMREDDRVVMHNVDEEMFGPQEFSIGEELPSERRGDWLTYIDDVDIATGDWGNYLKAATLYLQDQFPDRPLRGMNVMVSGNIPLGAGISSSSALVVSTLEAAVCGNGLDIPVEEKVRIAGEGEWYVGTRGGWGDQAGMLYGRRGMITHITFFPLLVELVPFVPGYTVVVCNSLVEARKSAGARSTYNEKVANYEIGLMLIKAADPGIASKLEHLRDVNEANLGWNEVQIYELLKKVPETIERKELLTRLPSDREKLETLFRTHDEPVNGYRPRQVVLFGLAECKRGEICADFLKRGDVKGFGELMYISHDGDRAVTFREDGAKTQWDNRTTHRYLETLISDLRSGDPERVERARIYRQPGGYGCSIEELDLLVDITRRVDGVAGAGLTGAGLGGCVLVMVKHENVKQVVQAVKEGYYDPRGLPLGTEVCVSVRGAGEILAE